jgi:2-amino-4-hydroxy-6-hydroxymethyldihydropteridine diphosphokinase
MTEAVAVYVALGANLDDPAAQVERAIAELGALPESRVTGRSRLYLSRPAGYADQPDFINAAARLDTRLSARALLDQLLAIEQRHGRVRSFRNSPRTLDLDILLYDRLTLSEPGLHLPHPRMHERPFVLLPLAEIAPDIELPGHGPIAALIARLPSAGVRALDRP